MHEIQEHLEKARHAMENAYARTQKEFIKVLKSLKLKSSNYLASIDVTSLFTNKLLEINKEFSEN